MALSANVIRDFTVGPAIRWNSIEVIDAVVIYVGAAVGLSAGRGRPLIAADSFLGFADGKVDMVSPASLAAGDLEVRLRRAGDVVLNVVGVTALTDVDDGVYASDDGTFTITAVGNTLIGKIARVIDATATTCLVSFEATSVQSN